MNAVVSDLRTAAAIFNQWNVVTIQEPQKLASLLISVADYADERERLRAQIAERELEVRRERDKLKEQLQEFLGFFCHMRVCDENAKSPDSCDIRDLRNGRDVTIGYARSQREVDELNQAFERIRFAMRPLTGGF